MENWQCLLLLTAITLRPCSGGVRKNDDGIDPFGFLRNIYSALLLRDEPFVRDSELKELRRPANLAVIQQTKDKALSQGRDEADGPVVFTKNGQIKGVTVDKAHIFYGVPYADPPVGAYRWKPPRPVSPWSGVYNASFPRAACMQVCSGSSSAECPKKGRLDSSFRAQFLCPPLRGIMGSWTSRRLFSGKSKVNDILRNNRLKRVCLFGLSSALQEPPQKKECCLFMGSLTSQCLLWRPSYIIPTKTRITHYTAPGCGEVIYFSPLYFLFQIVTDYVFLCPSRRSAHAAVATGSQVWMYVFDHVASDCSVWSGLTFCYKHVCHGAELPFLFDSALVANYSLSPSEKLLSNRMLCYWGAFAHTGDPSSRLQQTAFCREQRLPVWPRYSDTSDWLVMNLTVRSHAQVGTRNHICDFWDRLGIY
ncbi:hypothetical protein XENOCAPTIV_001599 [Xenoophorus captivus]|uniref:Carboxylesterase type B domain-containing protein n=1 Tax=Xenoophorus captivus TaxID=1517983 RepID=A0ABV0R7G3_9TELE